MLSLFFFLLMATTGLSGLLVGSVAVIAICVGPPLMMCLKRQSSVVFPIQISPFEINCLRLSLLFNRVFFPDNAFTLGVPLVRLSLVEISRHNLKKAGENITTAVSLADRSLQRKRFKLEDLSNVLLMAAELAKIGRFQECLDIAKELQQRSQLLMDKRSLKMRMQLMLVACFASWSAGNLTACEAYCQEALKLSNSTPSPDPFIFERFNCFNYLLMLCMERADYPAAFAHAEAAKEALEHLKGLQKEHASDLLNINTGNLLQHRGDYGGAESYLRNVYSKYPQKKLKLVDQNEKMKSYAGVLLAVLYASCDRKNEADEYSRAVRELLEVPAEILFKVVIANDVGYCMLLLDRLEEAEQYLHLSEEFLRDYLPEEHHLRATLLNNAADTAVALGKTDRASELLEECRRIRAAKFSATHPHNIRTHLTAASILLAQGKPEEALKDCDYVLQQRETLYQANQLEIASALNVKAKVLRRLGHDEQATETESRRKQIVKKVREQLSQPLATVSS